MDRKVYDTMDLILKTEKLKQLKEVLKEHNKDSRKYLDEFYKDEKFKQLIDSLKAMMIS